jgi:hypothetical protein
MIAAHYLKQLAAPVVLEAVFLRDLKLIGVDDIGFG